MLNKKLTLMLAVVLMLCFVFTSCAASKNDYDSGAMAPSMPEVDSDYGYGNVELPEKSESADNSNTQELAQKIIRTVTMDAQTKEFDKAVTAIRAALKTAGGFEETFRTTNRSYGSTDYYARTAYMVLRIPAEKLDAFLNEVGGMVHVTSQNANVQNVTSEYYDIEARLNVLESERAVYEKMLANAKTTAEKFIERPASDVHDFYRNFVKAMDGEEEQLITHDQLRRSMKIMEAAFESDKLKAPVAFEDTIVPRKN